MDIKNISANCVLLEWSNHQQLFHSNDVKDYAPTSPPNSFGWQTIHVCKDFDESCALVEALVELCTLAAGEEHTVTATTLRAMAAQLVKYADAVREN